MTETKALIETRLVTEDLEVVFDVIPAPNRHSITGDTLDAREIAIAEGLAEIDRQNDSIKVQLDALVKEIDRLTNHADGVDYALAVSSGVIAGALDSFWVGEFNFQRGKAWSNQTVNNFVMKVAKSQGYEGDRLGGAIKFLEDKFKLPSDSVWKSAGAEISAKSHHLDDFAHHPSPIGLFFSILTQFTQEGYFSNKNGEFFPITLDENGSKLIGHDFPSKILCGTVNWFMHLVSDMSGSNKTADAGMGIPGPLISLAKEISSLPGFKDTGLAKHIHNAYVKNKFDLRAEMAVGYELGRQALPVVLNEAIVRAFYFVRRLAMEIKATTSLSKIDWEKVMPWRNRTIVRMLTIAHGTFTAIDLSDAAIRAGFKAIRDEAAAGGASGGAIAATTFGKDFILRVNFVGIGRLGIAVFSDMRMGWQLNGKVDERLTLECQQLGLLHAKIYYKQSSMWIAAENAQNAVYQMMFVAQQALAYHVASIDAMRSNSQSIENHAGHIPAEFSSELSDILKWS